MNWLRSKQVMLYCVLSFFGVLATFSLYVASAQADDSTDIGPLDPTVIGADYVIWRKDNITLDANNTPSQFVIGQRCVNSSPFIFCSINKTQYENPTYSACAILDYKISPTVFNYNTSEYLVRINGYVHTPNLCDNRNLTVSCYVMCSVSSAS